MENYLLLISDQYPYLEVSFKVKNYEEQISAYLDTGFDGYLIIPYSFSDLIGEEDYVGRWELGDASTVESKEYLGEVNILRTGLTIPSRITCLGNECLLGRGIIDQFKITFDHGKRLSVEN